MREGWEIKKLGEVAVILNGYAFKSEKYENEGVRIIRITNVQKGYITDDDPKFYPAQEEIIDKYKLYPNDLLISLTGNVGRVGLMPAEMLPAALNQRVACIRPITQKLLLRYLFYHLNNSIFEEACIKWSKGLAQKNMSTEWLKEYPLIIPPLSEQKRIVAELDLLSEVIAKKREQLTQLDALAQSLFYTMFGDPITNEKGWETKSIDKICVSKKEIKRASSVFSKDDRIIYIDISSIDNVNNIIMSPTIYNFGEAPSRAQQVVQKGDILISLVRPNLNNVSLITTANPNLVASSGFCVLRATNEINTQYLFFFVKMDHCREYLMQRVAGANYPAIKIEDIMRYKISLPPLALQQQFAEKIEAIEQQKERIRQSLAEVQLLFDSRMDYYFNEWAE